MSQDLSSKNGQKRELSGFVKALTEPLSKYGWPSWLVYTLAIIGVIYILNPTFGLLELIPDNLPIIGNIDESVAVMLILAGIVEALEGKKAQQSKNIQRSEDVKGESPEADPTE